MKDDDKPNVTLSGTVARIVKDVDQPEVVEVRIDKARPLYREIRIENTLQNECGQKVKLKKGAHVKVNIAADPDQTS